MPNGFFLSDLRRKMLRDWLDHGLELEERLRETLGVKGPGGSVD